MVIELQNNRATVSGTVGAVRSERCLRRLVNVFSRVLELPLSAGAAVMVLNFADFYCFFASSTGLADDQVQPHLIQYHSGTMIKLIVVSLLKYNWLTKLFSCHPVVYCFDS